MKKLKQIGSLVLALMLAVALSCPAFAAGNYTITIANAAAGHIYEAYQIFTGDLSEGTLSNIEWGNGINDAGKATLGDAAEKAKTIGTSEQAAAFAKEVAQYLVNPVPSAEANGQYTISGLNAGYYLVKDKDNTLSDQDDFYTAYIMEVVKNVDVTPKGDKPSLDKQIKHNDTNTWGVVGDNQIGDTVEFRTITTVPNTEGYTTYSYVIYDTMSAGLTSNVKSAADVEIKVNDTGDALPADYYSITANGNSFELTVDVIKAVADGKMTAGDSLYTYYSGVLNKDALIYDNGNQNNTAHLEYSNNPNDTSEKGKTPEKKVYDWTFKMGINKVDGEGNALTEAKFVLSKSGSLKIADMACDENGVPTVNDNLIALIDNADGTYTVAPADYDGATTYVITAGSVVIKGLDDSTDYYLYETKAPNGYNLLKDAVKFNITAAYSEDGSAMADGQPTVTVGTSAASTTLSTNVVNNAGSQLPTTGGMGTTVLYVVGGALVVCAGVALVAKKRMQ